MKSGSSGPGSQKDTEQADLERESRELELEPELHELQGIYIWRGLDHDLALRVAQQLTARGALAAHARDELGISEVSIARPVQAALASAATFALGAALPLSAAAIVPLPVILPAVAGASLVCLAGLGALAARAGGAGRVRCAVRGARRLLERPGDGAHDARRTPVRYGRLVLTYSTTTRAVRSSPSARTTMK